MSEVHGTLNDVFVAVDGLQFHCRVEGAADGPWMIFSNSLATNLSVWDEQVDAFRQRYRILRYDQRGHGKTDVPSSPCTFDRLAEDAAQLLEHFGIEEGVFVGVSMGAVTALRLAQRFPERLRAVIACDGQPSSPPTAAETWEQRIVLAQQSGMDALVEPTVGRWFHQPFLHDDSPRLEEVRAMIRTMPAEGYIACARALQHYDFRKDFSEIQIPVLLLVGAEDGVLPKAMRTLHETMPTSTFVEIAEAGHLPNIERAASVTKTIEEFLARIA